MTEPEKGDDRMDSEFEHVEEVLGETTSTGYAETGAYENSASVVDALPPDTVDELCSMFGCTRDALGVLLSSTSADPNHVLSLINALSPSYIAIKLRFETRKKGEVGGAACVIAEGRSGELVDTTMWVSSRELPVSFNIHADWEAVRNAIQKMGNTPDRALFPKVMQLIKEVFSPTAVNTLYSSATQKEYITEALEKSFLMVYHSEIVFDLSIETFNKTRLDMGGLGEVEKAEVTESESETPLTLGLSKVLINCKPILDPVKGKAVSEISSGDYLYVEVVKTGALSSVIDKILSRAGEHPAFQVTSVERLPSGQYLIKLFISKGIEGLARVSADLRLKIAPLFTMKEAGAGLKTVTKKALPGLVFTIAIGLLIYILYRS